MRAISLISRYVVRELHDLWGGRACCVAIRSGLFIGLTGQRLPRGEPPRIMCGREHRFATFWQRSLAAYRRPSPTRGHSRRRPQLLTGGCSLRNFRIDLTHGKPVYGETRAGAVPLFPNDPVASLRNSSLARPRPASCCLPQQPQHCWRPIRRSRRYTTHFSICPSKCTWATSESPSHCCCGSTMA